MSRPVVGGNKAPPEARGESGFVGLANQGATCYLNSLIQALYLTPELRAGLFALDPQEHLNVQGIEEFDKQQALEKAGGNFADESLVEQLKGLGMNEHGARRSLIAVKNTFDAAMEFYWKHSESPGFCDPPPKIKASKKPRLIPLELQRLFSQLQLLQQRDISTEALTTRGFQWQGIDGRVQHDAHELIRLLIEATERSLKNTPGEKLCSSLYGGKFSYRMLCQHCRTPREPRVEPFLDLQIQVIHGASTPLDMARSLRQYCAAEILEGIECDACNTRNAHHRYALLDQLPPILTLSCMRFRCDKSTNFVRVKITDKAPFPLVIDMAPFADGTACAGTGEVEGEPGSDAELGHLREIRGRMLWIDEVQDLCLQLAAELINRHGEGVRADDLDASAVAALLSLHPDAASTAAAAAAAELEQEEAAAAAGTDGAATGDGATGAQSGSGSRSGGGGGKIVANASLLRGL